MAELRGWIAQIAEQSGRAAGIVRTLSHSVHKLSPQLAAVDSKGVCREAPVLAEDRPTVFVVDDDPAARDSVAAMIRSRGMAVESYASAEQFFGQFDRGRLGCLVTDVRMAGMSGLGLLERLKQERISLPAVVITGYGDVPTAVEAMRVGAVTFLEKPCGEGDLCKSIGEAIETHRRLRQRQARLAEVQARFARLTPGEARVLEQMMAGKPNKAIAADLQIGLRTVELRRANVMKKIEVDSVAELVRLAMETP
jgi:FixJ family two-component response regulator